MSSEALPPWFTHTKWAFARRAEFYRRDVEGYYTQVFGGGEGVYQSEVIPGFWLNVEWPWQEPLPKVLDVLREMELI